MLPRRLHTHSQFFKGAAYLDSAAIPEQFFDLAQDHRHGIGGKAHPTALIKIIIGLDKPHTACAVQVIVFHAAPTESARTGVYQPQVLCDECFAPGLIRYHIPDRLSFLCRFPLGQALDQQHFGPLAGP